MILIMYKWKGKTGSNKNEILRMSNDMLSRDINTWIFRDANVQNHVVAWLSVKFSCNTFNFNSFKIKLLAN